MEVRVHAQRDIAKITVNVVLEGICDLVTQCRASPAVDEVAIRHEIAVHVVRDKDVARERVVTAKGKDRRLVEVTDHRYVQQHLLEQGQSEQGGLAL